MANLPLFFGLIAAGFAAAITYWRKKKVKLVIIWSGIAFLGVGTILHFIISPVIIALLINNWFFKRLKKNWIAFLLSIPGVIVSFLISYGFTNLFIPTSVSGPMSLGEGLAIGIGMGLMLMLALYASIISYLAADVVITIARFRKKK